MVPHRIHGSARLSNQSSEFEPPTPSPAREGYSSTLRVKGEDRLACGGRGPNYDDATDTLVFQVYYNSSTGMAPSTYLSPA
jgi:hypothetical protein